MSKGQGLPEVKLGGKCKICIFFVVVDQLQLNLICRHSRGGLVKHSFVSNFYSSYKIKLVPFLILFLFLFFVCLFVLS